MAEETIRLNDGMPGSGTNVTSNERGQRVKLVRIDCPADIFDVEGAYIMRRKRVPVAMADQLLVIKNKAEGYPIIAALIPQWHGIIDVETGEALEDPENNVNVFDRLDVIEQIPWLFDALKVLPKNR